MKLVLHRKTSLLALGLSASGSSGLFCLALVIISVGMAPIGAHPLDVTCGIIGGILALIISVVLLWLYARERKHRPSLPGIVIDLLLLIAAFFPFFWLWGWIEEQLSRIF